MLRIESKSSAIQTCGLTYGVGHKVQRSLCTISMYPTRLDTRVNNHGNGTEPPRRQNDFRS